MQRALEAHAAQLERGSGNTTKFELMTKQLDDLQARLECLEKFRAAG